MQYSRRWTVTLSLIFLVILVISSLGIYFSNYLKNINRTNWQSRLVTEAQLFSNQVTPLLQNNPIDKPLVQEAIATFSQTTNLDLVIILEGQQIIESNQSPSNFDTLDCTFSITQKNTFEGNINFGSCFSKSLNNDIFYTAIPVWEDDDIIAIIQLGTPFSSMEKNLSGYWPNIISALLLTILITALLVAIISDYSTRPLRELTLEILKTAPYGGRNVDVENKLDETGKLRQAFNQIGFQLNAQINELQSERAKLEAVLANISDGIMIINPDGFITLINPAAEKMFQIDQKQALESTIIEVVRHHQLVEAWQKCINTGKQQTTTLETSLDHRFIQGIVTPLHDIHPNTTLILTQDFTRLRRLEVVRRDFVSNVSHELRTPLASLKALTETLQEGALEDPPAAKRFLLRMESEIDNLTQMVQELLELSRIESRKVPLKREAISPKQLLNPAVERMQVQAERVGLQLTLSCPDNLPKVYADPERIQHVLINLIHNAIKFTPPGGNITATASNMNDEFVVFCIYDTGVGIDSKMLSRIFERFFKADRARSGGGTGLGLSIVRNLVEAHGGQVWAESAQNQGSSFSFSLPIFSNQQ